MTQEARDNKAVIRQELRSRLRTLTTRQKEKASLEIREELKKLNFKSCALFASTSTEPNLLPLLKELPETIWFLPKVVSAEEMIFIPATHETLLQPGAFGIREPVGNAVTPDEIEAIACPGIAFSSAGHRLGQGGGFYDRFLSLAPHIRTIGVGFSCQLEEQLPTEFHDARMNKIILR
ncbi:MAG: 5-formyltetrahydrofolate cyclo-ligase [Akkermansiaceae bacterium]